jgi:hydrogenase maturation protein HypF
LSESESRTPAAWPGQRWVLGGIVQGVGLRPRVLRLAREFALVGTVRNESTRVVIEAFGPPTALGAFGQALQVLRGGGLRLQWCTNEVLPAPASPPMAFEITPSTTARASLGVAPDLATCDACTQEALNLGNRRHRYAFTACAECGPRLSVFQHPPYDRANTSMAPFPLCTACETEYADAGDRRFHAQAMACPLCGPQVQLVAMAEPNEAQPDAPHAPDAIAATAQWIDQGKIVLIKGLGGYQLACDATHVDAVNQLRALKRREAKPFALLARDVTMLRRWCDVSPAAEAALLSAAAPIVILPRRVAPAGAGRLADAIAPGLSEIGAMLPCTALHHLLMRDRTAPIVLTSGNVSDAPQAITLAQARQQVGDGVHAVLDHNRAIERRVDDSVGRVIDGQFRVMRRARGYAPAPLALPPGFDQHTSVLALGGDLKNTFALIRDGQGVLSQHMGDLHDLSCLADQQKALRDYLRFYDFKPDLIACDGHPGYAAHQLAEDQFQGQCVTVSHHHAHIAACLGEHGWPLNGPPVLGIALDGLGLGDDGQLWGGELLLCTYQHAQRVGHLRPMPLLGGDKAAREPWRNTYAHLSCALGWERVSTEFGQLALVSMLAAKPRAVLEQMIRQPQLAPPASSTGRLFDAVAAALGLCTDRVAYEGEAAMRLEALVHAEDLLEDPALDYALALLPSPAASGLACLDPTPMWLALLNDLARHTPTPLMAARFHRGLARSIARLATQWVQSQARHPGPAVDTVALSGGVFQNRHLTELLMQALRTAGLHPLLPAEVPCNDGGLAWGQALVALARHRPAPTGA